MKAAILGGGVIGGGWLARLIENGIECRVFDPDGQAERKLGEVLAGADRAYAKLTMAPRPARAAWSMAGHGRRGRRGCRPDHRSRARAAGQSSRPSMPRSRRSILAL